VAAAEPPHLERNGSTTVGRDPKASFPTPDATGVFEGEGLRSRNELAKRLRFLFDHLAKHDVVGPSVAEVIEVGALEWRREARDDEKREIADWLGGWSPESFNLPAARKAIDVQAPSSALPLDRDTDEVAPLGPRPVVVAHRREPEQVREHEPCVA
jgi:hypothetical protein